MTEISETAASAESAGRVRPRRGLVTGLSLLFGTILICSVLLELGLRFYYTRHEYNLKPVIQRSGDPLIRYELRPNTETTVYGVNFKINSAGFRGDEFPPNLPDAPLPGRPFRIVVIGDSIGFGFNLEEKFGFPRVLNDLLNSYPDKKTSFEVLNLSVPGYNTEQEVELIKTKVADLKPDLVILAYCLNDVEEISGDPVHFLYPPRFKTVYYFRRLVDYLKYWMSDIDYYHYIYRTAEPYIEKQFHQLSKIKTKLGVPVVVTVFPAFYWTHLRYEFNDIHSTIERQAKLNNLEYFDLLSAFAGYYPSTISFDNCHPNKDGNRLAAEGLEKHLLSQPEYGIRELIRRQ